MGSLAIKVLATDSDDGDFGDITYELIGAKGMFAIDSFTVSPDFFFKLCC